MRISALLPLLPLPFALAQVRPHHGHAPRHPHPAQLQQTPEERAAGGAQLDERGMPITATTTLWHMVTRTETVWVQPTDQAVFLPVPEVQKPSAVSTGVTSQHGSSATSSASTSSSTSLSGTASLTSTSHSHTETASATHTDSASSLSTSHGTASHSSVSSSSSLVSSSSSTAHATSVHEASLTAESASVTSPPSSSSSSSSSATGTPSYVPYSRISGSGDPQAIPMSNWPEESPSSSALSVTHTGTASSSETTHSHSSSSTSSHSANSTSNSSLTMPSSSTPSASATHSLTTTAAESSLTEAAVSSSSSHTTSVASSSSSLTTSHSTSGSASSVSTTSASSTITASSSNSSSSSTSSTSSSSAAPSSTGLPPVPSRIMAGYYPDWSSWYIQPEQVDYSRFDILDFAFAIPTESGGLEFTQTDSSDLLHRLVKAAHAHGRRVKLSVGGWTGSKFFSPITADVGKRGTFVKAMVDAYWTYNLDGIDIDWEYPGAGGAWGNIVSPDDSANYLLMLQELRAALPQGALITLATQVWPFTGSNGSPLKDVKGFAAVIDWILIMNYDIWGSSSNPGPNAPLSDACGNSTQPLANAYASVSSWTQAGLAPSQITIGVPAYGYLMQSWATSLRQRDLPAAPPAPVQVDTNATVLQAPGDRRSVGMEKRYTTISSGWSTTEGQVMWHDLVSQGALTKSWNGEWVGAGGFTRYWDSCSSTPWLKSAQSGQIVTYDDPESMSLKGQFAAQAGLRGCNVFSVDGDWTNGEWPLTDATRSGLGL